MGTLANRRTPVTPRRHRAHLGAGQGLIERCRLVVIVAAAVAVSVTAAPATATPRGDGSPHRPSTVPGRLPGEPAVGVQVHAVWDAYTDADRRTIFKKLAAAGVTWVRIDLGWAGFEPRAPGVIATGYTQVADTAVREAHARGLHVLAMLWWSPPWARRGGSRTTPPTDPNTYARFAGWAAQHFRGRVDAWEIWNEPNDPDFWTGTPVEYAALLRAAYPAIKAGDPAATVVIGAPVYNDTSWLAALYEAGIQGAFDVMASHPYLGIGSQAPETPDNGSRYTLTHVAAVHALMVARGDGDKPIWFTEFGWSSHPNRRGTPAWQQGVSTARQADYLIRTLRWIALNAPYVNHAFWYEERDQTVFDIENNHFGLLTAGLRDKSAYTALKAHLRS